MKSKSVNWTHLITLEPKLQDLRESITPQPDTPPECTYYVWAQEVKPRLRELVGWFRAQSHPILSSPEAYGLAAEVLRDAVPACPEDCTH